MNFKVWKDKSGKWITAKEFASRFSQGVQEVSPVQQAKVTLFGQFIVLAGIILGLFINGFAHIWWLFIILCGSLFVAGVSTLGSYQKYTMLRKMFSPEDEDNLDLISEEINNSQESPRVEKPDEMLDYETTNGVVAGSTRISTTVDNMSAHPDSYSQSMKGGPEDEIKIKAE